MTASGKPSALIKPTLDTRFYIDFTWWERSEEDLNTYLLSHLLPEQRGSLSQGTESRMVDHIDEDTGEVFQLDELALAIRLAAADPNFISPQTSLVDSIFRVFLANGNLPQTPHELAAETRRDANTILKTLSGTRIYKGIRPYMP